MPTRRDHGSLSQNRPRIVRQKFISLKKKHFYTRCAGPSVYALLTVYGMYCTDHMVNFLYKVACIFANLFHYFQIILIAGIHIVLTFRPGQTGLNVGIIDYLGHLPLPLSLNLKFIFVLSANFEARKGSKQKLRTYLKKFVLEFSFASNSGSRILNFLNIL